MHEIIPSGIVGTAEYGIIGYGVVGKAIAAGFDRNAVNAWVLDTKTHPVVVPTTVHQAKAIFVCVNTPAKNGRYDITNLKNALYDLECLKYSGVVIIVSTMGVNEYREIKNYFGKSLRMVVCPEFLTAENAEEDFYFQRNVIYGPWISPKADAIVREALTDCKDCGITFTRKSAEECVLIKTGKNLTLFLKLIAANLVYAEATHHYLTSKQAQDIVNFIHDDPRLKSEKPYHKVGCHEGTLGVAGTCLPKDAEGKTYSIDNKIVSDAFKALTRLNRLYFRQRVPYKI